MAYKISLHHTKEIIRRSVEIDGYKPVKTEYGEWLPIISVVSLAFPAEVDKLFDSPGAYVLVGPIADPDGRFPLYVGKSTTGGLGSRLKSHAGKIYSQAVVLHGIRQNKAKNITTEDQSSNLEYFFHAELDSSANKGLFLEYGKRPKPRPCMPMEQKAYEEFAKIAVEIVRLLLGTSIKEPISESISSKVIMEYEKRWKPSSLKPENDLARLIKAGGLKVGEKLETTSPSYLAEAIVGLENDRKGYIQVLRRVNNDGNLIKDKGKKKLYTPSGAGKYVSGYNTPGWTFWRLASDSKTTLDMLRKKYL